MLQFSAHFSRFSRSFCSLLWSFWLLISRYNKQSSAKNLTDDLTASGRSFMWKRNSMGPSTVPCGTPESTVICWDDAPSNVTLIFLFVRKFISHLCTGPLIPYWSNLCSRVLWGTVSKAFEKSNIAMSICLPLS